MNSLFCFYAGRILEVWPPSFREDLQFQPALNPLGGWHQCLKQGSGVPCPQVWGLQMFMKVAFSLMHCLPLADKSVTGFSGLSDIDSGKHYWLKGKIAAWHSAGDWHFYRFFYLGYFQIFISSFLNNSIVTPSYLILCTGGAYYNLHFSLYF